MKSKKLILRLKKDVISNLQAKSIRGGGGPGEPGFDLSGDVEGGTCISPRDGTCNSANGCTGGPDETMTCPDWSCAC